MKTKEVVIPIVLASDCPPCACCGEPWCKTCEMHYADCDCIGPHNAEDHGFEVVERDGKLVGVKAR